MKTKYKPVKECYTCKYNDTGALGGDRDEEKGICFRCTNFSNHVDMRLYQAEVIEWPIEDELIGRGD